jgi:hypothetical protein
MAFSSNILFIPQISYQGKYLQANPPTQNKHFYFPKHLFKFHLNFDSWGDMDGKYLPTN